MKLKKASSFILMF